MEVTTNIKKMPTSVRFTPDIYNSIKAAAKKEHRSISNWIEAVILNYFADRNEDEELTEEECISIQRGLEDIKNGRTYRMQEDESLTEFLKRTEKCIK